jgi:hypothetical protein
MNKKIAVPIIILIVATIGGYFLFINKKDIGTKPINQATSKLPENNDAKPREKTPAQKLEEIKVKLEKVDRSKPDQALNLYIEGAFIAASLKNDIAKQYASAALDLIQKFHIPTDQISETVNRLKRVAKGDYAAGVTIGN